eukprot:766547-Prymnesium_polylepis.1
MTKNTLGALAPGGYTRTQNARTARAIMVHIHANCLAAHPALPRSPLRPFHSPYSAPGRRAFGSNLQCGWRWSARMASYT